MTQPQRRKKETCRKSTGPRDRSKKTNLTNYDDKSAIQRTIARLKQVAEKDFHGYSGPRGQGIGKGGVKRILKLQGKKNKETIPPFLPRKRDIERFLMDQEHSIPMAPFRRAALSALDRICLEKGTTFRLQYKSLEIIRDVAEAFLVEMFEMSFLMTCHANRVTLFPRDMHLIKRVTGNKTMVIQ